LYQDALTCPEVTEMARKELKMDEKEVFLSLEEAMEALLARLTDQLC